LFSPLSEQFIAPTKIFLSPAHQTNRMEVVLTKSSLRWIIKFWIRPGDRHHGLPTAALMVYLRTDQIWLSGHLAMIWRYRSDFCINIQHDEIWQWKIRFEIYARKWLTNENCLCFSSDESDSEKNMNDPNINHFRNPNKIMDSIIMMIIYLFFRISSI
jgi:hypothetical protein